MTTRNLYEVLGLVAGADGAMVDQAYWHLAKTYQQQAPRDPRAEGLLDELNEAYGVLGTPRLREQYDLELRSEGAGVGSRLVARPGAEKPARQLRLPRPKLPFGRKQRADAPVVASPARAVVSASSRVAGRDKAQDLHASTAAMLQRWRSNAGIQPAAEREAPEPDMTLVDIFRTERQIEGADEPLTSVMEVLKRSRTPVEVE